MKIAVGLIHWPIYDRQRTVVATNVTNLDVHDIARACRVYGIERYYIIHPMQDQHIFISRMLEHWRTGDGAKYNPMRKTSLTMVHTAESIEAAVRDWGGSPALVATHAGTFQEVPQIGFRDLRAQIEENKLRLAPTPLAIPQSGPEGASESAAASAPGGPADADRLFILFGTGFGLTEEVMRSCSAVIEPIRGASLDDYRHLSVRSAVSICLDRLLGPW
jgi:hypothetical protein